MTESEWQACCDPLALWDVTSNTISERKARLVGCACTRRLWHFLKPKYQAAVETTERFADGRSTYLEQSQAHRSALDDYFADRSGDAAFDNSATAVVSLSAQDGERFDLAASLEHAANAIAFDRETDRLDWNEGRANETAIQISILRDVFGNPFRPVTFDPNWRTSTAVALATQMYDSRDFSTIPILADALQDAGCDHADILDHCRGPSLHVRGCWVVDLVLGKS